MVVLRGCAQEHDERLTRAKIGRKSEVSNDGTDEKADDVEFSNIAKTMLGNNSVRNSLPRRFLGT